MRWVSRTINVDIETGEVLTDITGYHVVKSIKNTKVMKDEHNRPKWGQITYTRTVRKHADQGTIWDRADKENGDTKNTIPRSRE